MDRHPANIALDEWLRTKEGRDCAAGRAEGEYMQNRLYWAFMAGWKACESQSEVAGSLPDEVGMSRSGPTEIGENGCTSQSDAGAKP